MSELQKSFAKSKLAKLPPEVPTGDLMNTLEETQEEDGSSASSLSSTGTLVPSPTRQLFARTGQRFVFLCIVFSTRDHIPLYNHSSLHIETD